MIRGGKTQVLSVCMKITACNIEVSGAKALGELLKTNTTLTNLCLIGNYRVNECTDNTIMAVCPFLGNLIGDAGVTALSEGLKTNTTLEKLDITSNRIKKKNNTNVIQNKKIAHLYDANRSWNWVQGCNIIRRGIEGKHNTHSTPFWQ